MFTRIHCSIDKVVTVKTDLISVVEVLENSYIFRFTKPITIDGRDTDRYEVKVCDVPYDTTRMFT